MGKNLANAIIIIRSVGERTEQVCRKLIHEQGIQKKNIVTVREVPFSMSMKKSFEIGIEQDKKWTFCIDADVLLRPHSISSMIEFAESQKSNVCEVQGLVLDKFFSGPREAGNHLYRTSLLEKVLGKIPDEGTDIRPETYTLNRMAEAGYPWVKIPYLVGIHDDEQYNFDIYRKAFVQAVKHLDRADLLISHWKKNIEKEPDFRIALKAFSDSIINTDEVYINREQNLYKEMFAKSGFGEKEKLDVHKFSLNDIEKKISEWDVHEKYYDYFPDSHGLDHQGAVIKRKIKHSLQRRGIGKTVLLMLSQSFTKIGQSLGRRIPE